MMFTWDMSASSVTPASFSTLGSDIADDGTRGGRDAVGGTGRGGIPTLS